MYAYSDIYGPDTMGEDLKTLAAVDGENQSALATEGSSGQIATDRAKSYNITMALLVMAVLIVLLQMSR